MRLLDMRTPANLIASLIVAACAVDRNDALLVAVRSLAAQRQRTVRDGP